MPNSLARQLVDAVCKLYSLDPIHYVPPSQGYRNHSYAFITADRAYTIILYKDEPDILTTIRQANTVGDFVAHTDYPARQTVDGRIIQIGRRYACLYYYLPGSTIPWEAYTRHHLRELGRQLALLHSSLAGCTIALPAVADRIHEDQLAMRRYFADKGVKNAMKRKLHMSLHTSVLSTDASAIARHLPNKQPLHLDFVRGNVLFAADAPHMTGVIDFEKSASGHPIIDIARTLAFLVVDCKYKSPAKVQEDFLVRGYQYHSAPFTNIGAPKEVSEMLRIFINHYVLFDFYKFLRHSPYESLSDNDHFRRTAALLLRKGLIQRTDVVASTTKDESQAGILGVKYKHL